MTLVVMVGAQHPEVVEVEGEVRMGCERLDVVDAGLSLP
jgi:hypothetical protein